MDGQIEDFTGEDEAIGNHNHQVRSQTGDQLSYIGIFKADRLMHCYSGSDRSLLNRALLKLAASAGRPVWLGKYSDRSKIFSDQLCQRRYREIGCSREQNP